MVNPNNFIREHIQAMEPYSPILPFEVLSEALGIPSEHIVKLDANENPYGPAPQVIEALEALPYPHIYPDPESRLLRQKISAYYQLDFERILAGAGADELIDLLIRAVIESGDRILNCPPTFGMYGFDAAVNNGMEVKVYRGANFELDFESLNQAVQRHKPKLLFLANPNNPDGGLIPREILARILNLPILVVVDEAYIDFSPLGNSLLSDENKSFLEADNLIVLRTFSKWAGLAGLRIGFGYLPAWLMPTLWKIKQPYNVSVPASRAAIASLENAQVLKINADKIMAERGRLFRLLEDIPWLRPYPSQANFILCKVLDLDAGALKKTLAEEGILIRHFNKKGLRDHVRITIGKPVDTDRLMEALTHEGVNHGTKS